MLNIGILINKEENITSYDVIRRLKRIIGYKKIGHAGTLDPFASGVLVILVDNATKVQRYIHELPKEYEGVIELGIETDTWDREGRILKKTHIKELSLDVIEKNLKNFEGEREQIPPPFSAVKIQGERAYRLARRGMRIKTKPKKIKIEKIEFLSYEHPFIKIRCKVSSGTYIRALARDIASSLGTIGILKELKRIKIGKWEVSNTLSSAQIEMDTLKKHMLSIPELLYFIPKFILKKENEFKLKTGRFLSPDDFIKNPGDKKRLLVLSSDEKNIAVYIKHNGFYKPERVIVKES